jgi:hypothetical protein
MCQVSMYMWTVTEMKMEKKRSYLRLREISLHVITYFYIKNLWREISEFVNVKEGFLSVR